MRFRAKVSLDELNCLKKYCQKVDFVLEIGTKHGGTSGLLADEFSDKTIVTIDKWRDAGEDLGGIDNIVQVIGESTQIGKNLKGLLGKFGLIFIDGHHGYESVKGDFETWFKFLKDDGYIAFHDAVENEPVDRMHGDNQVINDPNVTRFINTLIDWKMVGTVDSLAIMQKDERKYNNPLIIMGPARSGTTVLSRILREHPQVFVTMEGLQYSRFETTKKFVTSISELDELNLSPEFDTSIEMDRAQDRLGFSIFDYKQDGRAERTFKQLKKAGISSVADLYDVLLCDEVVYGDKSPEYIYHIESISRDYEAKYIMCIRDPRDIWCSQVKWYHQLKSEGKDPHVWMEPDIISAMFANPQMAKGMNAIHRIDRWDMVKGDIDGIAVYYDRLVDESDAELKKIADFLNVSTDGLRKGYDKYFDSYNYKSWQEKWEKEYDWWLPEYYKEIMRRHGYI